MANFLGVDPIDIVCRETSATFELWELGERKFSVRVVLESNVENVRENKTGQFWRLTIHLYVKAIRSDHIASGYLFSDSIWNDPSAILDDFIHGNLNFVDENDYRLIETW